MPKISRNTRNGWSVITKTSKWCRPSAIRIWRHCWRMSPGYVASPLSLLSNFFTQRFCQISFWEGLKLQLLVFSFFTTCILNVYEYVILKFVNEYLQQHADDFNTTAALYELYKYIQQYYEDVSIRILPPLDMFCH